MNQIGHKVNISVCPDILLDVLKEQNNHGRFITEFGRTPRRAQHGNVMGIP